ncbi:MAG TPA: N-acetylmannosamine kinase, partial [Ruminococcus bromii]|nr:N-acetylmannosamine kinase [Ruminococcus bromii]
PLVQSADSVLIARSDMASIVDSLVAPLSLINALIVATVLKKKDEVSDTFRRLELVWNRDGVYTNRDREIMGNIEDDDK